MAESERCRGREGMTEIQINIENPKIEPFFQDNCYFIKGMLNTLLNPVCYKDRNGVYLGVNDIYARQIAGLPEEEIVGCTMLELGRKVAARFPERALVSGLPLMKLVEEWHRHDTELFNSGGTSIHEYEGICADGIKREFLANRSIFRNEKGEILGLITVLQDITERNEARKKLQENEERHRVITEQTGQLVYENNLETNKVSWAGAVEKVFGYSIEEIKELDVEDWFEHIHPEDRDRVIHTVIKGRKAGVMESFEYRLRKKDGTYICIEDTGTYFESGNGKPFRVLGVVKDITEQKLTREQLEKSEERYRIIVERTGQLVYDYDLKTDIGSWTGAIEEITGYAAEEFQKFYGTVWTENIHPDDREQVAKAICEAKKTGKKFQEELRFRRKDGTYIYIEDSGVFLLDEKGSSYRVLGVLKDITERKLAQDKRLESEEKYRNIVETANEGIIIIDDKAVITFANHKMTEVFGYDLEEGIGRSLWDYMSNETRAVVEKNMEKWAFGIIETYEVELTCKDGSSLWALVNSKPLFDENWKNIGILAMLTDITERKKAEEKLRESEEKYRSFTQSFEGIVFQLDNNFFPEFMHGGVEEITGYLEEDFLSGRVSLISSIHPEDVPFVLKDQEEIQSSPYNLYRKLDFRLIHRNGKIKWLRQIYQNVQGKNGKPDKYQGNLYDITEKKEAEIALGKMEEFRQKEIHHRIKNNLQVISSLLDLQAEKFINNRECIKDSEILEAFRESQDRVVSIALIHEELHEGAGTNTLNFSLYLKRLVKNLFHTYRLGHADISLNIELEEKIFFDMDAAVPLGLIVNELVSNSLKHAFPGRETGKIQIKLYREEAAEDKQDNTIKKMNGNLKSTRFILMVSDNGIGISRAVDIKNSDTLGIQLVNLLVEQLEGEIEIKRDNGTEFIIKINVTDKS
jgi:PAS domain S-box-containing protein